MTILMLGARSAPTGGNGYLTCSPITNKATDAILGCTVEISSGVGDTGDHLQSRRHLRLRQAAPESRPLTAHHHMKAIAPCPVCQGQGCSYAPGSQEVPGALKTDLLSTSRRKEDLGHPGIALNLMHLYYVGRPT